MRTISRINFLLPLCLILWGQLASSQDQADSTNEPPLTYSVFVDGKQVPVVDGKPLSLKGKFLDPTITVKANPYRKFYLDGLSFDYPRDFKFGFHKDQIDGDRVWSFTNDDRIEIHLYASNDKKKNASYRSEAFLERYVFAKNKSLKKADPLNVTGGKKLKGMQLICDFEDSQTKFYYYDIPSKTKALVLEINDQFPKENLMKFQVLQAIIQSSLFVPNDVSCFCSRAL